MFVLNEMRFVPLIDSDAQPLTASEIEARREMRWTTIDFDRGAMMSALDIINAALHRVGEADANLALLEPRNLVLMRAP